MPSQPPKSTIATSVNISADRLLSFIYGSICGIFPVAMKIQIDAKRTQIHTMVIPKEVTIHSYYSTTVSSNLNYLDDEDSDDEDCGLYDFPECCHSQDLTPHRTDTSESVTSSRWSNASSHLCNLVPKVPYRSKEKSDGTPHKPCRASDDAVSPPPTAKSKCSQAA